jgi:hypothetical protein
VRWKDGFKLVHSHALDSIVYRMLIQFAQYASLNPACMSELNVDNALLGISHEYIKENWVYYDEHNTASDKIYPRATFRINSSL